jgi:peptide/nickel transport system permease protein
LAIVALAALAAPWISPHDPDINLPAGEAAPVGAPGALLGTDSQARDILSRLIWGGRISLFVAIVPTFGAMIISLVVGIAAGYFGGWLDWVIMRILDVFFAFPLVLLAIAIAGVLQPGLLTESMAICIALIPYISRVARTATAMVVQQPYIEAAHAGGAGRSALLVRYLLPNMFAPVLIYCTTLAGLMIVVGAGMSYLGLGVQPPTADWGTMVSDGSEILEQAPHVTIIPGLAIVFVALAFNYVGDTLRDGLDPYRRRGGG